MSNKNVVRDTRSNFGTRGWLIILYALINYYLYDSMANSALNAVVPGIAEERGFNVIALTALSTPAALIALVVSLFAGKLTNKIGAKKTQILTLFLGGISVILWGQADNYGLYATMLVVVVCLTNVMQLVGGTMLVTNWFPRKKGLAMGWATMGLNLSGATSVTLLTILAGKFGGMKGALTVWGVLFLIAGVATFFVHDYPEEVGCYPDNDPSADRKNDYKLQTGWTSQKVLSDKMVWVLGISLALQGLIVVGFVSQLVPLLLTRQFEMGTALTVMTVANLGGAVGSYIWGWIDQKFGIKVGLIALSVWMMIGCIMYFLPGTVPLYVMLFILGSSLGGPNNYAPSSTTEIYGRDGSQVAFPIIYAITGAGRALPFAMHALSLAVTHDYKISYGLFAACALISIIMFIAIDFSPKPDPMDQQQ